MVKGDNGCQCPSGSSNGTHCMCSVSGQTMGPDGVCRCGDGYELSEDGTECEIIVGVCSNPDQERN